LGEAIWFRGSGYLPVLALLPYPKASQLPVNPGNGFWLSFLDILDQASFGLGENSNNLIWFLAAPSDGFAVTADNQRVKVRGCSLWTIFLYTAAYGEEDSNCTYKDTNGQEEIDRRIRRLPSTRDNYIADLH